MDLLVAFGEAVRSERLRRELTQQQLAELAGLHHNYISLIERGKTAPALDTVFALAKGLDCKGSKLVEAAEARLKRSQTRARPRRGASS
jgi:transcriptional regulator with XRE-family HTH domain